ncbi:hypothetical protein BDA99DRAFT_126904 [Phascolomyces articulosus]|uniref:Uncharacterized protein n=1 Tax=Phascolomyces articulosus TaxID=60185 RepID=A0AAD5KB56_9FUNG|nr:hypothetical protein BDA99DRAFT_126904 [Phascolomyces articulosus]
MYYDPAEVIGDSHYHARHSFTRKFCGCMSLRGGCAIVCAFWAGLHLYIAIMAFQLSNPVFSYLDRIALNVMGGICVLFVTISFYDLISLFLESMLLLRIAHRLTWIVVAFFLICYFVCIILFGIQKQQFREWCIESAFTDQGYQQDMSFQVAEVYNCDKLWEDELKLAIAIFMICAACYVSYGIYTHATNTSLFHC